MFRPQLQLRISFLKFIFQAVNLENPSDKTTLRGEVTLSDLANVSMMDRPTSSDKKTTGKNTMQIIVGYKHTIDWLDVNKLITL